MLLKAVDARLLVGSGLASGVTLLRPYGPGVRSLLCILSETKTKRKRQLRGGEVNKPKNPPNPKPNQTHFSASGFTETTKTRPEEWPWTAGRRLDPRLPSSKNRVISHPEPLPIIARQPLNRHNVRKAGGRKRRAGQ